MGGSSVARNGRRQGLTRMVRSGKEKVKIPDWILLNILSQIFLSFSPGGKRSLSPEI
jgi:hypothetical protein